MFTDLMEEEQRRVRRNLKIAVGLGLLGLGAVLGGPAVLGTLRNDEAWRGPYVAAAGIGVNEQGGVPWRRVHEELLPAWIVALGQGSQAEEDAFGRLSAALGPDEELHSLAVALREYGRDPRFEADALFELSDRWSRTLDARGAHWRIEAGVVRSATSFFYVKTYEVVADGRARVGEAEHRVRLLRRADTLNVREGWLGHTATVEEGGLVVIKRIVDFTADDLWLLFAQDEVDPDPIRAAFGAVVRAEAETALPEETLAILRRTAPTRLAMRLAVEGIQERARCSNMVMSPVPWFGLDARGRDSIERLVEPYAKCPAVTREEADALLDGSLRLRRTAGLDAALAHLAGWMARGVAVHELRHAADIALHPEDPPDAVDAELSAYLASFSTEGLGAVALFQACVATQEGWGEHAGALAITGFDCEDPPADVVARARARAVELGLPNEPILLPADYAVTVPLPGE